MYPPAEVYGDSGPAAARPLFGPSVSNPKAGKLKPTSMEMPDSDTPDL